MSRCYVRFDHFEQFKKGGRIPTVGKYGYLDK